MEQKGRKIVASKEDSKQTITAVRLKGNKNFTSIEKAIYMTKRNLIDAVYVKESKNAKEYIRTRPDNKINNNLDEMAKR